MKKKLVIALCLVMSLSLLLCSCGTDNSQSDNNTDVKTTAAPTLIPQGESQSIPTTGNNDPIVTVPSISEDEVAEPSEDIVTDPSEDDATEPSEVPAEPTVAPTEPTVAPTEPTVAPTKPSTPTQAHKHSYTAKVTKAATCTTAGVKTYTCSSCQHQYTETIVAAGHKKDSGTVTKAATCSATGVKTYKCTVCQTVMETATIAKTAHKWGSWTTTKAATVLAKGTSQRKCSKCSETDSKDIAQLDNNYVNNNITNRLESNDINYLPVEVWFTSDGKLHVKLCLYNNTNKAVSGLCVDELYVYDKNGILIAAAAFNKSNQKFTLAAGKYIYHTYTFDPNLGVINTYTPDMSLVYTDTYGVID